MDTITIFDLTMLKNRGMIEMENRCKSPDTPESFMQCAFPDRKMKRGIFMNITRKLIAGACSAVMLLAAALPCSLPAQAADIAHDPGRDVQTEGVGNPSTSANAWRPKGLPLMNCAPLTIK